MLFFALRDFEPGEEITLDYIASYHSDQTQCRCGAPSCRGHNQPLTEEKEEKEEMTPHSDQLGGRDPLTVLAETPGPDPGVGGQTRPRWSQPLLCAGQMDGAPDSFPSRAG